MKNDEVVVDLNELLELVSKAIKDYININGSQYVILDEALYWMVLDDDVFDLSSSPTELGVGNLVEEFSSLRHDFKSGDPLGSVSIQHISALLMWLSAKAGRGTDFA